MNFLIEFYVAMMFVMLTIGTVGWTGLKTACEKYKFNPLRVLILMSILWPVVVYQDFKKRITEER